MDQHIIIDFGNEITAKFSQATLMQVTFFKNYFSQRWQKNRGGKKKNEDVIINLFGKSNIIFSVDDFRLFFRCIELKQIPCDDDKVLTVAQLDGLAVCSGYLASKDDTFIVTKKEFLDYLKHRRPRIPLKERQSILNATKSPMLRQAIIQWNHELHDQNANHRNSIIVNHHLLKVTDINFDSSMSSNLLIKIFKPHIIVSQNVIVITVPNLNFKLFLNLWERRKVIRRIIDLTADGGNNECKEEKQSNNITQEIHYQNAMLNECIIPLIIEPLEALGFCNLSNIAFGSEQERLLITRIVADVCDDFVEGCIDNNNVNVNLVRALECHLRLHFESRIAITLYPFKMVTKYISHIKSDADKKHLLNFLLNKHKYYGSMYHIRNNDPKILAIHQALQSWYMVIRVCLFNCHVTDIIEKVREWFPILNDGFRTSNDVLLIRYANNNNSFTVGNHVGDVTREGSSWHEATASWIKSQLVPRFNTEMLNTFLYYVSEWCVFTRKNHSEFSPIYTNLMKEHLGITWDILPKK